MPAHELQDAIQSCLYLGIKVEEMPITLGCKNRGGLSVEDLARELTLCKDEIVADRCKRIITIKTCLYKRFKKNEQRLHLWLTFGRKEFRGATARAMMVSERVSDLKIAESLAKNPHSPYQ